MPQVYRIKSIRVERAKSVCTKVIYTPVSTHQTGEIRAIILGTSWLTVHQISQSITPQPLDQTLWVKFGLSILESQDPQDEHIQGFFGLPMNRPMSSRGKRKGINFFFLPRVSTSKFRNKKGLTNKNRDIVKTVINIFKSFSCLPRTRRTCSRGKPKGVKAFSVEGKGGEISKRKGTYCEYYSALIRCWTESPQLLAVFGDTVSTFHCQNWQAIWVLQIITFHRPIVNGMVHRFEGRSCSQILSDLVWMQRKVKVHIEFFFYLTFKFWASSTALSSLFSPMSEQCLSRRRQHIVWLVQ